MSTPSPSRAEGALRAALGWRSKAVRERARGNPQRAAFCRHQARANLAHARSLRTRERSHG